MPKHHWNVKQSPRTSTTSTSKRGPVRQKSCAKKDLEAKFAQNPKAMQALLETGHKRLVECTHDGLWGNGIPLYQPNCLNQQQWKRHGILGELLQDIRARHLEIARTLLPANPWFQRGPPNFGLSPTNQPVSYIRSLL